MEETKADILLSYGYTQEAIKFYKKVLKAQPDNNYAKYNIFVNSKLNSTSYELNKKKFSSNLNLALTYLCRVLCLSIWSVDKFSITEYLDLKILLYSN